MPTLHDLMTEDDLKEQVVAYAQAKGWLVHHDRPARRGDGGWATHIEGDPGFPDLVLARNGVVHYAELKREGKDPTHEQMKWLEHLGAAHYGAADHVHVWRPSDLPAVRKLLA